MTATAIAAAKPDGKPYELTDPTCAGLQLRVLPSGAKSWLFRFYWHSRRVRLQLGPSPRITLARARELAGDCRRALDAGIDPRRAGIVSRATKATPMQRKPDAAKSAVLERHSVAYLADEFLRFHVKPNRRRPEYVERILEADVLPRWRDRDARTIKPREVIELLDGIVERGSPVMANHVAQVLKQMFLFGVHRELVEASPVQLLYRPGGREKPRERALSDAELTVFLAQREAIFRSPRTCHVLVVLLLTLQRRSEVALAQWREFDFDEQTWRIPDSHAKTGRGHVVPLSDWAVTELKALKKLAGRSGYVFPRADGAGPADPKLLTRSVERCRKTWKKAGVAAFTVHDFRRTGRTALARLGIEPHIAERVVNHRIDGMEGVYNVHDYAKEKREALEKWARHLEALAVAK